MTTGKKKGINWKKLAIIGAGLTALYSFNRIDNSAKDPTIEYPLPAEIKVTETTLPFEARCVGEANSILDGVVEPVIEKWVKTEDIDFSKDFEIKTERYNFASSDDMILSKWWGQGVGSLAAKLFFWDWDMGRGLDETRTREALGILENNEQLRDLTVRVNHNRVWYDTWRLFNDEEVKERNPFLARLLIGLPGTFLGEFFSELTRGDYYNPMTQSAILYSNVESISAHELGHHQDFQRFDSDWLYTMGSVIMPVRLFKEAKASLFARDILSEHDSDQFNRYLVPAFATYLLAGWAFARRQVRKRKLICRDGSDGLIDIIGAKFSSEGKKELSKELSQFPVSGLETGARFVNNNLAFYAGVGTYLAMDSSALGALAGTGVYLIGNYGSHILEELLIQTK